MLLTSKSENMVLTFFENSNFFAISFHASFTASLSIQNTTIGTSVMIELNANFDPI